MEERVREFYKTLPVSLTREEVIAFGDELTSKMLEKSILEEEEKQRKEQHKAKMSSVEAEIARLAVVRRTRKEERQVLCYERRVGIAIEIVRLDTGEVVSERPMTDRERQEDLKVIGSIGGKKAKQ